MPETSAFVMKATHAGQLFRRSILGAALFAAALVGLAQGEESALDNEFTVARADKEAYKQPVSVLSYQETKVFKAGRSHFKRRWIAPITFNGEWGLGPTFIQTRCSECHINNGRGSPPATANEQLSTMLVRLSLPGTNEHGSPRPDPNYGDQFQNNALQAQEVDLRYARMFVPAEAKLFLDWEEHTVSFVDGEQVSLRKPLLRIEDLAFGELGEGAMFSLRNTPPIIGLGLLEAVAEDTVLEIAKSQKQRGVNGRPNYVWDAIDKKPALGRFGWKANAPSLMQQTAGAFLGDLGVTSWVFRENNCPPVQIACLNQDPANDPEIIDADMDDFELWLRTLAVPARRDMDTPLVQEGKKLFGQAGCDVCHVPQLTTATEFPAYPKLANRTFNAYTDLLLHDMGEGLADGRPDYLAGGRDWRTTPLWGLGLSETVNGSTALLHDGRARNVSEAILWHGGEAEVSREVFRGMPKADRDALVKFVESI
ncbi:MAG TPA: di-heme oxidoredictase family protein [Burkholderiales bacterium]|nr:di-heme oxidoredictase family protein [Burkholderiales bacterium]